MREGAHLGTLNARLRPKVCSTEITSVPSNKDIFHTTADLDQFSLPASIIEF